MSKYSIKQLSGAFLDLSWKLLYYGF